MTTHNTHDDNIDADTSVVEPSSASETISPTSASIPEIDATAALSSPEQTPATESTEVHDAASFQTNEQTTLAEDATPDGDLSSASLLSQTLEGPSSKIEEADTLAEQTVQSPSAETFSSTTEDDLLTPLTPEANSTEIAPLIIEETTTENVPLVAISPESATEESAPIPDANVSFSETTITTTEVLQSIEPPAEESEPVLPEAATGPFSTEELTPSADEATFPYASILSFAEPKSEEVRSFSDFIEEFRQAEALQETHVDFSLLTPSVTDLEVPSEIFEAPTHDAIFLQNTSSSSPELVNPVTEVKQEEAAQKKEVESLITAEGKPITERQEIKPDLISGQLTPTPITRVSPLLRPASRLRIPRHASRHHRDEPLQESLPAESVLTPPPVAPTPVEPQKPAEPVADSITAEQPRPARRYRFDRPAATTNVSPRASVPAQSSIVPPVASQRPEEVHEKENIQSRGATFPSFGRPEPSLPEPVAHEETLQSEPVSPPSAKGAANTYIQEQVKPVQEPAEPLIANLEPSENGRRRHHQERPQKEQAVVNAQQSVPSAAEIIVPALPVQPEQTVAPEDLPPLEYADLQKANPRRRRRHRNAPVGANGTVQSTPEAPAAILPVPLQNIPLPTPAPAPAPVANVPLAPAAQRNLDNQFSIVSGYTVSQMNQGNEVTGPFMGPEPSPARGSGVISRDGRITRAEMQRTPVYPPAIRATTHEAGPSASSMNHFANVVSQSIQQSIQLQTDRMVTELRRANQAPTSISVSLPPFPSTERVGVFVDVANLLYSARTLRIGVDFGKLLDFLRGNRRLVRAHAYCPTSPQAGDEQMFLQAVKGLGYRITTKNYKTFSSGAKKADLDLDLCMDVVRLVDGRAVDCIVLVSGDSDFMPMLDYCSDHGVRVEVAAFDEAMSATLRQSCDLFVNLSMLEEIRS